MAAVCILVFDEAHHASRSHPYCKILEDFFFTCAEAWRPQLLGLTASPAGETTLDRTMSQLLKLSSIFSDARVLMPSLYLPEMESYTNRASTDCVPVTLTLEEQSFRAEVAAYLGQVNARIQSIVATTWGKVEHKPAALQNPFDVAYRGELRSLLRQARTARCPSLGAAAGHAAEILGGVERGTVIGPLEARRLLAVYRAKLQWGGDPRSKERLQLMDACGWPWGHHVVTGGRADVSIGGGGALGPSGSSQGGRLPGGTPEGHVLGSRNGLSIFTATEAELMQSLGASRKAGMGVETAGSSGNDAMDGSGSGVHPTGTGWHSLASSRVVALLEECFRTLEENPTSRILVFVQTRGAARELVSLLQKVRSLFMAISTVLV